MAHQPTPPPEKVYDGPERRLHVRKEISDAQVLCASGEFEELKTAVNFGRELVNISPGGACLVTSGALRPGIRMNLEARFGGGKLATKVQIIWSQAVKKDSYEFCLSGFRFVGEPTMSSSVRELLESDQPRIGPSLSLIQRAKRLSKEEGPIPVAGASGARPRRARALRRVFLFVVLAFLLYVGTFWGVVMNGQVESEEGIHFHYWVKSKDTDRLLASIYRPAYAAFRAAGVGLEHVPVD